MINIAIVEDEVYESDKVKEMIERYALDKGEGVNVTVFNNSAVFVSTYKSNYDVIFLDIEMPVFNGMETAQKVRALDKTVIIVFITNMEGYAIRGYSVEAMDFIVKPLVYPHLVAVMDKICNRLSLRQKQTFTITTREGTKRVLTEEILFIEVQHHRLYIHMLNGDVYDMWGNMNNVESQLTKTFVRINACYLINLQFVKGVERDFALIGDEQLKISRNKKNDFYNKWIDFIGGG